MWAGIAVQFGFLKAGRSDARHWPISRRSRHPKRSCVGTGSGSPASTTGRGCVAGPTVDIRRVTRSSKSSPWLVTIHPEEPRDLAVRRRATSPGTGQHHSIPVDRSVVIRRANREARAIGRIAHILRAKGCVILSRSIIGTERGEGEELRAQCELCAALSHRLTPVAKPGSPCCDARAGLWLARGRLALIHACPTSIEARLPLSRSRLAH